MRVGTWNCRSNIDKKSAALDRLAIDVVVIPESAASPTIAQQAGVSHAWSGRLANKGLGVFAFAPWTLEVLEEDDPLPWCLPFRVRHADGSGFTLLAVWTVKNSSDGHPPYAEQFTRVIDRWAPLIAEESVVIAGDLNASRQGPSIAAHQANLQRIEELGAHSGFHLVHGPMTADEEPPTLRWIGPGRTPHHYHCDFVFVSQRLAASVRGAEVGSVAEWIESGLSDHCPVVVELDLGI